MQHIRITLKFEGGVTAASNAVEALRQRALALPFQSTDSCLTRYWHIGDADNAFQDHYDFNARFHDQLCDNVHGQGLVARHGHKDSFKYCRRNRGCGFMVQPLPESLPVSFGLFCRIPFRNLGQWTWRTFTTVLDDASKQRLTAVKSHLAMVRLIDHAKELRLLHEVVDPSGYFDSRKRSLLTDNDPRLEQFVDQLESFLWPNGNKPQAG